MNTFQFMWLAGTASFIFMILIFLSCRCIGGAKILEKLFRNRSFLAFYKMHCVFWWGFAISMLLHLSLGIYLFGWIF